ncbi:MAG: CYTH domain-containing protein [Gammaproteobacteria bacterium]
MAIEIERKYKVPGNDWRQSVTKTEHYRQGYLAGCKTSSVRVRITGDEAFLNIKSATLGVRRSEYDYPIPVSDAEEMLGNLCGDTIITKTRYFVPYQGMTWEIDVFDGKNDGLIVAEVELENEDQKFEIPSWIGEEVSDDPRYYNVCLVNHPYCEWGEVTTKK